MIGSKSSVQHQQPSSISLDVHAHGGNSDDNKVLSNNDDKSLTQTNERRRKGSSTQQNECILDADSSSTKSGRRPSVDTVSTYLSHESKDSTTQVCIPSILKCTKLQEFLYHLRDILNK